MQRPSHDGVEVELLNPVLNRRVIFCFISLHCPIKKTNPNHGRTQRKHSAQSIFAIKSRSTLQDLNASHSTFCLSCSAGGGRRSRLCARTTSSCSFLPS